jgi:hypothetical protein
MNARPVAYRQFTVEVRGGRRVFGRRRHERQEQVIVARGEAAVAFRAMDELAHQVVDRLSFAAHVDGDARGQALLDRARLVSAEADAAAMEWLRLQAAFEPGEQESASTPNEELAQRYLEVRDRLIRIREAFNQLVIDVGSELGAIEQALAAIPRRVHEARQALHDAQAVVEAMRLDGLAPETAEQALIRVHLRAEVLDEGAAVHGITEILAAADEVIAMAAEARRRAERFPHQRDDVARRLVAARSHLDAAEGRGPRLESGLAALRRGYIDASFQDLEDAPLRFQAALDDAADALDQAEASARRLAYAPVFRLLEHARVALTRADAQVRLVTGRLATLDALQADPRAPLAPVQFALDDARSLCTTDGVKECTVRLSDLGARLKAAPELIGGGQPDFYGYLVEVDAIQLEIGSVVTELRRG